MYQAIVTLIIKADGLEALHELPLVEVHKFEFDTENAMWGWLNSSGSQPVSKEGLVALSGLEREIVRSGPSVPDAFEEPIPNEDLPKFVTGYLKEYVEESKHEGTQVSLEDFGIYLQHVNRPVA
jgi:hypothetical protein